MTRTDEPQFDLDSNGDEMIVTDARTGNAIAAVPFGPANLGPEDPAWIFMDRAVTATNAVAGVDIANLRPGILSRMIKVVAEMDQHHDLMGAPDDDEFDVEVKELARELGVANEPAVLRP